MYGLPGQSLEEVQEGIEFIKSLEVRINLTEYSPIPQTDMFNLLVDKNIISENIDPLLTNNTVFTYLFSEYNIDKLNSIKLDVKIYNSN